MGDDNLLNVYRGLLRDSTTIDNEYRMWWTNTDAYAGGLGCAYLGVLGRTPRDYGGGWTSFRNFTLETVGQTFMQETGHLMDADHSAVVTSHRCRLLDIFEFDVAGPSRSWAARPTATCAPTASRSRSRRRDRCAT